MIPVAQPDLSDLETHYVNEALKSTLISSSGPFVDRFENDFASACGVKHALSTSSGTSALHLALAALDVGPGDEVIVPSLSYVAVANAVTYLGATPVFADVDRASWCISAETLAPLITRKTRGIIVVHLYGLVADMDPIVSSAKDAGLWIVEDAAEAHFASYKGRPVGGLGTVGIFSFYGNKIMTCGEGGAVTTDHDRLASRMKLLRGQAALPDRRYYFEEVGYNFRLTNIACALLCAQLERSHELVGGREGIYLFFRSMLDVPGISFQPRIPWGKPASWIFPLLVRPPYPMGRDALAKLLYAEGIDTRPFFEPLHTLPPYRELHLARRHEMPVSLTLAEQGLQLPTFRGLSLSDAERICQTISEVS